VAYDKRIKLDPDPMPLKPAILVLMHRKKRMAYIGYTSNARGRAAVLASMIRHRDSAGRSLLRGLPEGGVEDFTLTALKVGLEPALADKMVRQVQKRFERDGLKMFGANRSAVGQVVLDGERMTIVEAMKRTGSKQQYQAIYRRLQRGWDPKEAFDLVGRE
jgi:hypothetical protein